jgi:NAD(P)-dependent dehydrogenase (short-subunit alcohol dehydrogenase family)
LVEGKIALVTGAGSGIGRATAELLGEEGAAAVVVSDLDEAKAQETVELLRKSGHEALAIRTDVSRADEVDALVATTIDRYSRIDCAVNNAGVRGQPRKLGDVTDDEWRSVQSVNLDGVFYCLRAEIRAMQRSGGGTIVNTSSGSTAEPTPQLGPYVASKFGVLGLTRVAAGEYASDNIRINAVLPGTIRTPLTEDYWNMDPLLEERSKAVMPFGKFGEPGEVAEAIVWLCSPRSSFVNAVSLLVDSGMHSFSQRPRPRIAEST